MGVRALFLGIVGLVLAGCVGTFATDYDEPMDPAVTRGWKVRDVNFAVPPGLSVGEGNRLAPDADIVWFGDPPGDRRAQVDDLMTEAIGRAGALLDGTRPVVINASLIRFHAITPMAVNLSPAGVHNITYEIEVLDAVTGERLTPATTIRADLAAFTGAYAVVAAQQGQTERVRIVDYVAMVTAGWLGVGPDLRGSFTSIGR